MTNPSSGERPEVVRAMQASVDRLQRGLMDLIDNYGQAVPVPNPAAESPHKRRMDFSEAAIVTAGFEPGSKVYVYDTPIFTDDEGTTTPTCLGLYTERIDKQVLHERDVSLEMDGGGMYVAQQPDQATTPLGSEPPTGSVIDHAVNKLLAHLDENENEVFSQAECDRWIRLVEEERKLRG